MIDVDNHQRSVLHMAVEGDFPTILSILLENAADPDLVDDNGNNRECSNVSVCEQYTMHTDYIPPPTSIPGHATVYIWQMVASRHKGFTTLCFIIMSPCGTSQV